MLIRIWCKSQYFFRVPKNATLLSASKFWLDWKIKREHGLATSSSSSSLSSSHIKIRPVCQTAHLKPADVAPTTCPDLRLTTSDPSCPRPICSHRARNPLDVSVLLNNRSPRAVAIFRQDRTRKKSLIPEVDCARVSSTGNIWYMS